MAQGTTTSNTSHRHTGLGGYTPAGQVPGRVIEQSQEPRSYRVEVPSGEVRRNRVQLRSRAQTQENTQTHETSRILEYRLDLNLELLQDPQTTLVIAKEGRCGVKCD